MFSLYFLLYAIIVVQAKPAPTKGPQEGNDADVDIIDTGLNYDTYLQNVIKLLETDDNFRKEMEEADFDDIRNGKLSNTINKMSGDIRTKLNELKKAEINRLRKILHVKADLAKGRKVIKSAYLKEIADHLDHENPHSFEASDLTRLIKAATKDLEQSDQERHEEFKKHEMQKEIRREEKMRMLNERDRERAQEEYIKKQNEAKNKGMHHPGSKAQLEEVWNDDDGLNEQEFNPKTFFRLHDLNNDGYLDELELESLFEKDLAKSYNEEDGFDQFEMDEERRRMRDHVVKEVDKDGDYVISLDEFLKYSLTSEFADPDQDSYRTINELLLEHSLYTQNELMKYKDSIEVQEKEIKNKLEVLKQEAKNLGGMRREYGEDKRISSRDGIQEEEKIRFEQHEVAIKEKEEEIQEMHKELQDQSKLVVEMKQEVKKHEASEKIANNIKEKIDSLPEGEEKVKAVEKAHEELESLKEIQGMTKNDKPDEENNIEVNMNDQGIPQSKP